MKLGTISLFASLAFAGWVHAGNPTLPSINTNNIFNAVTGYGASTSNANNASAINAAITAAAGATGGGTVEIPGPGIYLTGPLTMRSKVNLQIDAGAILRMLPYGTWSGTTPLLNSSSLSDLEISGSGAIDGQGAPWWASDPDSGLYMVYFDSCQRVLIQNLTVSNAPAQQIVFKGSSTANVTIQGITITAPASNASSPSHNTDGIDLVGSNSLVQNCVISTGDDNIAMGSSGAPTYNTVITNCTFGNGHGVSIGSYTTDGVTNLTVIDCTFNNTDNGIRMKSDSGRGGTARYLNYCHLTMTNITYAPILIYSYYDSYGNPTTAGITPAVAAGRSISNTSGEPIWSDIVISNLTATAGQPGMIWARLELPATNILLSALKITANGTFDLYNIIGVQIVNSQITNTGGNPTFALCNAQATFSNSVPGASVITLQGDDNTNSLAFYNAPATCNDSALFNANPITLAGSLLSDTTGLTLPAAAPVNFTLGTNAATVNVTGNLTLNSTLNISNAGGFTATNYTLFNYTGTESGQAVLGSTPAGFPGFIYTLSTNTSAKEVLFEVSKTVPTLVSAPTAATITYGQALSASTLTNGSASVPGSFAFTTPSTMPGAGTGNQSVTFTPSNSVGYTTFSFNVSVTVLQATPTLVSTPTASAITVGQALSASTLSGGSASVPGSFAFTTPTLTPGVGTSNQSVTFTPTNNTDYSTITFNISVTVNPAPHPVITSISLAGTNLTINGNNGVAGTYTVLTSTDPTLPVSSWQVAGTFTLSATGGFSQTVNGAVTVNDSEQFYILQAP
ncbi:MAG: glycosyl hydrolase family 28 protein [Limisphaerales bacterium]